MKNDTGKHYRFEYKNLKLDPARIMLIYNVTHPMQQIIVKKSLVTGERGNKNLLQDIDDIITACNRWKEMIEDDKEL